jgi:hypothetical protein
VSTRTSIPIGETDLILYPVATLQQMRESMVLAFEHARSLCFSPDDVELVDEETGEIRTRRLRIVVGPDVEDKTLRQLRFYFGPVLRQISEQAVIGGHRYSVEAFHELFKRQILGFEVTKVAVAGRKRVQVYRRLRSVRDLSVKQMSAYLDEVIATAATDLGVAFVFDLDEREAVRWKRKPRKAAATRQAEEAVA